MFITYRKTTTINHMIVFNDSGLTSASFEAFAEVYLYFLVSAFAKKNAETTKFLEIFKKNVSKNKIYFCFKEESNFLLNNKVIFVFHMIFNLNFITQMIYCIIHICLYSLFILCCSLISVSKKRNIETMLILLYQYNWQNFNNKMNEEKARSIRA